MKHGVWYWAKQWKVRIALLVALSSALGLGLSQSEAGIRKVNEYAERYINSRVDMRMECMTREVTELKRDVKELTKSSNENNKLMRELILVISKRG